MRSVYGRVVAELRIGLRSNLRSVCRRIAVGSWLSCASDCGRTCGRVVSLRSDYGRILVGLRPFSDPADAGRCSHFRFRPAERRKREGRGVREKRVSLFLTFPRERRSRNAACCERVKARRTADDVGSGVVKCGKTKVRRTAGDAGNKAGERGRKSRGTARRG